MPHPVRPLNTEFTKQRGAASGVRSKALRLIRRANTAVALADGPDHPEAIQRRFGEQGLEPGAEDTGMHEVDDDFTDPALFVVHISHTAATFQDFIRVILE